MFLECNLLKSDPETKMENSQRETFKEGDSHPIGRKSISIFNDFNKIICQIIFPFFIIFGIFIFF